MSKEMTDEQMPKRVWPEPARVMVRLMAHLNGMEYGKIRVYGRDEKPLSLLPGIATARAVELREVRPGELIVPESELSALREQVREMWDTIEKARGNAEMGLEEESCHSCGQGMNASRRLRTLLKALATLGGGKGNREPT